ncbi:MAG: gamma-glutamylcyclotransferase family protein [Planctomycetota bacterium]
MTCLLFVYGLLQPGYRPPRSAIRHWKDAVAGELFDLGPYPAAVNVGQPGTWIEGHVVEIHVAELPALDAFEEVDAGLYARKRVTTREGHEVWIYEFCRELPFHALRINRWTPR